jgi:hypothetical protein
MTRKRALPDFWVRKFLSGAAPDSSFTVNNELALTTREKQHLGFGL